MNIRDLPAILVWTAGFWPIAKLVWLKLQSTLKVNLFLKVGNKKNASKEACVQWTPHFSGIEVNSTSQKRKWSSHKKSGRTLSYCTLLGLILKDLMGDQEFKPNRRQNLHPMEITRYHKQIHISYIRYSSDSQGFTGMANIKINTKYQ